MPPVACFFYLMESQTQCLVNWCKYMKKKVVYIYEINVSNCIFAIHFTTSEYLEMTSIKKGIVQPKPSGFEWTIDRFFADCQKVGDYYMSPMFPIHHSDKLTKWYLKAFPKGDNDKCQDCISIFLHFQGKNAGVTVDYQVSLVGEQCRLSKTLKKKTFRCPEDNWGWPKFEKQDVIKDPKKGALIDDTLTILCEIKFHDQDVTEKLKDYDNLLDKIGKGLEDYEKLLESNCFSDVTFNIKDNKMYLHRAILMCRNPVFKEMFEEESQEKRQRLMIEIVEITDVEYKVMKEVFRFIYSGKVEKIEEMAEDLLIAADKYKILELKALCEKTLYTNLTVNNAIECLKITDSCDTIHLKTLVIKFIAAHYKDIVKKPEFGDLSSNVMHKIIQAIAQKN